MTHQILTYYRGPWGEK